MEWRESVHVTSIGICASVEQLSADVDIAPGRSAMQRSPATFVDSVDIAAPRQQTSAQFSVAVLGGFMQRRTAVNVRVEDIRFGQESTWYIFGNPCHRGVMEGSAAMDVSHARRSAAFEQKFANWRALLGGLVQRRGTDGVLLGRVGARAQEQTDQLNLAARAKPNTGPADP